MWDGIDVGSAARGEGKVDDIVADGHDRGRAGRGCRVGRRGRCGGGLRGGRGAVQAGEHDRLRGVPGSDPRAAEARESPQEKQQTRHQRGRRDSHLVPPPTTFVSFCPLPPNRARRHIDPPRGRADGPRAVVYAVVNLTPWPVLPGTAGSPPGSLPGDELPPSGPSPHHPRTAAGSGSRRLHTAPRCWDYCRHSACRP